MKIAFLAQTVHDIGGTGNAVVTQANALCGEHDVQILSVYRARENTHFPIDPRVTVHDLVDLRDGAARVHGLDEATARAVHKSDPLLIHPSTDPTLDGLADVALEHALPRLDADVLVTVTPALMAFATQLAPGRTAVVHQEHRASSQRQSSRELLLDYARRADVVAMLTEPMAAWMRTELGTGAPEVVVVPNAVPPGFRPRSTLTEPVITSAGRLAWEKQWPQLITAFSRIAPELPDWRLRIFGEGPARFEMRAMTRKLGLWDRVELPGPTEDMASEWARSSIMSLTSRPGEGFPLVIQEAMAAGVPVVAYDMPTGPRDQITDGVDGFLVTQGSVAGLASSLLRLATDDDLRHRIGAAALAKAATWDSATITAQWVEIYERAVRRRAGATGRATQLQRELGRATAAETAERIGRGEDPDAPAPPPRHPDQAPPGREGTGLTPDQARREAFAHLARIATTMGREPGDATWFAIPPHGKNPPTVVLPMSRRRAFLEALEGADLPLWLSVHDPDHRGWPSRRGTAAELVPTLLRGRTARVVLEPWPRVDDEGSLIGRGCECVVEFWERGPEGHLHAPDPGGYTSVLHDGLQLVEADVLGTRVPAHPMMLEPTVTDCPFEVDVVYTWVDGSDAGWNTAREQRMAATTDTSMHSRAASGRARYIDRGELQYSLRGIHLFAPWVRTIHLVTDGQVPAWLDASHPRINLVDHRDILPADALPTYNSHAIEAALHRIDGLAEHFLYFNDDMFLGTPSVPEQFFSGIGGTAVFFSAVTVGLGERDLLPWQTAGMNNRRLLHETFGRTTVNTLAHVPYAHRRSVLAEIETRFAAEVEATKRAPFRSATDLSMLSSFAQHYGLLTGTAFPAEADHAFVDITDAHVGRRCQDLLSRERDGFCLGDGHDFARDPELVAELVTDFLQRYFPIAAPWERG